MSAFKRLVFIRHAHRDTAEHARDNGLSDKGHDQVKRMVKFAQERLKNSDPVFITSPKKRCQETIGPLAKEFKKTVLVDQRLTEHQLDESGPQYLGRLEEFLSFWKSECPELTVVCSHGDWIPLAIQKLTGAKVGLKKSGWCEIEHIGDENFMTWLVQKYD